MNTHDLARANLERGAVILDEAQRLADRRLWNLVVRRCQETTELALKGALREQLAHLGLMRRQLGKGEWVWQWRNQPTQGWELEWVAWWVAWWVA